jgi:hypothetical protein
MSRSVAIRRRRARQNIGALRAPETAKTCVAEPMDARRRSAWLWCLVAACSKLLLMAAAATDDPELRATRRARGECDWVAKHFVIEDDAAKFPLSVKATITREAEPNPIHIHLNMTIRLGPLQPPTPAAYDHWRASQNW